MSQKSRDVVIFDGNGREVDWSPTIPLSEKKKYGKDPEATELIEVLVVKDGKLKSEWHEMFTWKQIITALAILAIVAALFVVNGYYEKRKSQERFEAAMADRINRGCKQTYPWVTPENGDKDEGCRPKGQAP